MKTKTKYQAAKGRYVGIDEWVDVSYFYYLWLRLNGYIVRRVTYEN